MKDSPFIPKKLSELSKLVDRTLLVDPTNGSDTRGSVGGQPFATIEAAVTEALAESIPPSPVPIHIAPGTYTTAGSLSFPSTQMESALEGLGRVYLTYNGAAGGTMLTLAGDYSQQDNYQLKNLYFDGAGGADLGLLITANHQANMQNIRIVGCNVALASFKWMVCSTLVNWLSAPSIEGYGVNPTYGYYFDAFDPPNPTAICANALISVAAYDYTNTGAVFADGSGSFGNIFLGGGFSGKYPTNPTKGVYFGTGTNDNGCIGTGLETNEYGAHVAGTRCFLMASEGLGSKLLIDGRGFYNFGGNSGTVQQNGTHGFYLNRGGGAITCGASGNYVEINPPEWHPQPTFKSANASGKLIMFCSGGGAVFGEAAGDSLILGSAGKSVWLGIDGAAGTTAIRINDTGVVQLAMATSSNISGNNGSGTYRRMLKQTGNDLEVGNVAAGDNYYEALGTHYFQTTGSSTVQAQISNTGARFRVGIGAWDTAPPGAKPTITGSRGSATATVLASLLTALASYGLITDSTTA